MILVDRTARYKTHTHADTHTHTQLWSHTGIQ